MLKCILGADDMKRIHITLLLLITLFLTGCSNNSVEGEFKNIHLEKGIFSFEVDINSDYEIDEIIVTIKDDEDYPINTVSSKQGFFVEGETDVIIFRYLKQEKTYHVECKVIYVNGSNLEEKVVDQHTFTTSTWDNIDPEGRLFNVDTENDAVTFDVSITSEDYLVYRFVILLLDDQGEQVANIVHTDNVNYSKIYRNANITELSNNQTYTIQLWGYYRDYSQEDVSNYKLLDEYIITTD